MKGYFKVSVFLCLSVFVRLSFSESDPEVALKLGKFKGTAAVFEGKKVEVYLGLPYAQPPVKDLRFKKPLPLTKAWDETLNATHWPTICPQNSPFQGMFGFVHQNISEDCLYLNIWTPKVGEELKPVLFFIHGGGYVWGSSSQRAYDSLLLAAKGDVVVVVINYRLGALGFLFGDTPDIPGNMGLFDQALALEWVQDNIQYFGGNPKKVTIFGESAGAVSVGHHILSPVSRNLFQKAIPMSGSTLSAGLTDPKAVGLVKAKNLIKLLGCSEEGDNSKPVTSEQLRCLRDVDAETIVRFQHNANISEGLDIHEVTALFKFVPVYGEEFIPREPRTMLLDKDFKKKTSVLTGVVKFEGSLYEYFLTYKDLLEKGTEKEWKLQLTTFVKQTFRAMPDSDLERIVDFYFLGAKTPLMFQKALIHAYGDAIITCPTLLFAQKLAEAPNNRVNGYFFTTSPPPVGKAYADELEAGHGHDLSYVFGLPLRDPLSFSEADRMTSEEMIFIWTQFAKKEKIFWPQYRKSASGQIIPSTYEINPTKSRRMFDDYKYFTCKLWESYLL